MSRVEELSVPRDFPESGIEPYKDMVAHLDRRREGRARVVSEESTSNPSSKREVAKERKQFGEKVKINVFHWPLGSWRKRF